MKNIRVFLFIVYICRICSVFVFHDHVHRILYLMVGLSIHPLNPIRPTRLYLTTHINICIPPAHPSRPLLSLILPFIYPNFQSPLLPRLSNIIRSPKHSPVPTRQIPRPLGPLLIPFIDRITRPTPPHDAGGKAGTCQSGPDDVGDAAGALARGEDGEFIEVGDPMWGRWGRRRFEYLGGWLP